jgi:4'-phosphopantetheinyl transferase
VIVSPSVPAAVTPCASVVVLRVPRSAAPEDIDVLSESERARAARFHFESDRSAFVTARAALRRYLGRSLSCAPERVGLAQGLNGRPMLDAAHRSALDFNVSHSGTMAALAFVQGGRVGVDIEWHGRDRGLRDLVPTVMGPRERAVLEALPEALFRARFFEFWTRKEAIVKAIGVGISYPLTDIDIPSLPAVGPVRIETASPSDWMLQTREPAADFTLSVALAGEDGTIGETRFES